GPPPAPPEPRDGDGRLSVLVELRGPAGASPSFALGQASQIDLPGFSVDQEFQVVPLGADQVGGGLTPGTETYVVRGTVDSDTEVEALRARPEVVQVWRDTPIAPFATTETAPGMQVVESMAVCPIPPCDCSPGTAQGNMADVAAYLGVDQIWAAGRRGAGIRVGVLDGGITALGRPVKVGETSRRIPRVVDGWPSDWGTEASKWGEHGNMCATDVLGMAPEVDLYDFRISGTGGSPGTISRALQAFQWAINRHAVDGTPQVLTNSWGIFQETWDTTYARNPNHPFTRKVVEAINAGILVLFAAGNCGATCPDGRCGPDNGPGRSIWGANSHPMVMTVGAVNKNEQFVGYSSQGPGALDPNKPDFCSITHFVGYTGSDSGTSAATPILAGAVALLKQAKPAATQDGIKNALKATAKDIGPGGFDQHSGAGIVQLKRAYDRLMATSPTLDLRITPILPDRIGTPVAGDLVRTAPSLDVRGTPVAIDMIGTSPAIDLRPPGGTGVEDTIQEHLPTIAERIGQPGRPPIDQPIGAGTGRPFVLATPHHAAGWQQFDPSGQAAQLEAEIQAVAASIDEAAAYLDQLLAAYEELGNDGTAGGV
ncbi:MAG: S8 family peptidase, partial [Acidimicrobiales bacterium]